MTSKHTKIRIALNGACGRMCRVIVGSVNAGEDFEIAFGVDNRAPDFSCDYPIFQSFPAASNCDVVVDFSFHTATKSAVDFAIAHDLPIVVATTGHTEEERGYIVNAGKSIPVFFAGNVSIGIYLATLLSKTAAAFLDDSFDIEILETHHRAKADFPSGTALSLANAIAAEKQSAQGEDYTIFVNCSTPRKQGQIRIHSLRGGSTVGKHQVSFLGDGESLSIIHETESKSVYVHGLFKAIKFILRQPAGIYGMDDLVASISSK